MKNNLTVHEYKSFVKKEKLNRFAGLLVYKSDSHRDY
jgi:hypothetical protein